MSGCTTAQPGPDWVCVGSNWLPPDHPLAKPVINPPPPPPPPTSAGGPPIDPASTPFWPLRPITQTSELNRRIEEYAQSGDPMPNGQMFYTPPLVLKDFNILRGSGRTILRPDPDAPPTTEPSITIVSTMPGNHELSYPPPQSVRDLIIDGRHAPGSKGQEGVRIVGANIDFDHVTIDHFGQGLHLLWAVYCSFYRCLFTGNDAGVVLGGLFNSINSGTANICQIDFTRCRFGHSSIAGAIVFHGYRIVFDGDIFENNPGKGLLVEQNPAESPIKDIIARDCWYELNGNKQHIVGPVIQDGVTGAY